MGSASTVHATAGLELEEIDNRVFIRAIAAGTPCAKIPRWKTRLRNTCLLAIDGRTVASIADVTSASLYPISPPPTVAHAVYWFLTPRYEMD